MSEITDENARNPKIRRICLTLTDPSSRFENVNVEIGSKDTQPITRE
jgi:hypothetical protein